MSFRDHYYWGPLINPDKSPAPLLEQLCLGIAQLMISFHECGTTDLTPERLAAFYNKVGGNYDPLFLETKAAALSFIYQSLGCFHSLQPSTNAFEPPSMPALLPSGFVRWQTIQILLDPDEHSTYLQNAVRMWDVWNPLGGYFPKVIPREAFPPGPDPEMVRWHEEVSKRLEYDYLRRNAPRSSPPNFGPYQYHYLPKDLSTKSATSKPAPKEEKAVARRQRSVPFRYVEPTDMSTRPKSDSHKEHRRSHKVSPRPERIKDESPPLWPDRLDKRASSYRHSSGPESMPGYFPSDPSSESPSPSPDPSPRRFSRRNLSPPRVQARRHSHEVYSRRPLRDISPGCYKRYSHETDTHDPPRWYDYDLESPSRARPWSYKDDFPPHPRHEPKFWEYMFDDPPLASSPESPDYYAPGPPHPQYMNGAPSYMAGPPPPRGYDPEDPRQQSYSGGGGLERSRSHAGPPPPPPNVAAWGAGYRGPGLGPKKYVSAPMPDFEYRRPMYDR